MAAENKNNFQIETKLFFLQTFINSINFPACLLILNANKSFELSNFEKLVNPKFIETIKFCKLKNIDVFFDKFANQIKKILFFLETQRKIENYNLKITVNRADVFFNVFGSELKFSDHSQDLYIFLVFENITERVSYQRKISQMADVFNIFPNGIIILIPHKNSYIVTETNKALEKMTGFEQEELTNKTIYQLPFWTNIKEIKSLITRLKKTPRLETIKDIVYKIKTKDTRLLSAGMIINAIRNINDDVIRINIMLSDITERLNAQNLIKTKNLELAQSNELIKNMTHTITHKINNFLAPLMNYTNLWLDRLNRTNINITDLNNTFNIMKKILNELNVFIDNSIKLSRYEIIVIEPEQINITKLFQKSVEIFKDFLTFKNQKITINFPDELIVFGNTFLIAELVDNLIQNALKYSPENSEIICEYKILKNNFIWIGIKSWAQPIPLKYSKLIFKPYYRLANVFDQPGDGLGLAICANIIKQHFGKIGVIPQKEIGNIFYFTLPTDKEIFKNNL